jgi:hypothetical protein
MKHLGRRWFVAIPLAALPLWSCQQGSGSESRTPPAQVQAIEGGELSRVILTEAAMERLGIETASVERVEGPGVVAAAPYGSLVYDPRGGTWVYTVPQARTFVRQAVIVASIEGQVAYLTAGPPAGTEVVSVGAAELLGTEFGAVR